MSRTKTAVSGGEPRARSCAPRGGYNALIRLFFGLCSTSARWRISKTGGTYIPNRPRNPFFSPYHPPTGFFVDRPQASTVPSAAGFCSSALTEPGFPIQAQRSIMPSQRTT